MLYYDDMFVNRHILNKKKLQYARDDLAGFENMPLENEESIIQNSYFNILVCKNTLGMDSGMEPISESTIKMVTNTLVPEPRQPDAPSLEEIK